MRSDLAQALEARERNAALKRYRQDLLSWLPIREDDRLLYLDSRAIASRGQDDEGIPDPAGDDTFRIQTDADAGVPDISGHDRFDWILIVGAAGLRAAGAREPENLAVCIASYMNRLSEHGHLVIAADNCCGMRRLAGYPDDETGRFAPDPGKSRGLGTFTRGELERAFSAAGVGEVQFYYPYPDLEYPAAVYSDAWLPAEDAFTANAWDLHRERVQVFDEPSAYRMALKDGLFPQISNAYLCVLSSRAADRLPVLYAKFSNRRDPRFAIRTQITEENGERHAYKYACTDDASGHIAAIRDNYRKLSALYDGGKLAINHCSDAASGTGVAFAFCEGETLEKTLDILLDQGDTEEMKRVIGRYFDAVRTQKALTEYQPDEETYRLFGPQAAQAAKDVSLPVSDIDLIFANAITREDGWEIIDYEWTFSCPVPLRFIYWRALHYYLYVRPKADAMLQESLYGEYGISAEECRVFAGMDAHFQQYVRGMAVTVDEVARRRPLPLHLDDLMGYVRWEREILTPVPDDKDPYCIHPALVPGVMVLRSVTDKAGRPLPFTTNAAVVLPAETGTAEDAPAASIYVFCTPMPEIRLSGNGLDARCGDICADFHYYAFVEHCSDQLALQGYDRSDPAMLAALSRLAAQYHAAEERLSQMEGSWSWKLTRPVRALGRLLGRIRR